MTGSYDVRRKRAGNDVMVSAGVMGWQVIRKRILVSTFLLLIFFVVVVTEISCGLYYKLMTIGNDDSKVVN
jgi:hypothetical protein